MLTRRPLARDPLGGGFGARLRDGARLGTPEASRVFYLLPSLSDDEALVLLPVRDLDLDFDRVRLNGSP